VPVKTVVGFNRIQAIQDEKERDYLLQTEFDYAVCGKRSGIFILVIEFDGIGGGFSRGLDYETHSVPIRDQNRRKKLEAKLGVCAEAGMPAVVVSFQETTPIEAAGHLTILDGIIGEVWAADIFKTCLTSRQFDSIDEVEDFEITLGIEKNPVKKKIARLLASLLAVDANAGPKSVSPLTDRDEEGMTGCRASVQFCNPEFTADVYIRDVNCIGFNAFGLADDLSYLAALQKAAQTSGIALPT
jgi:hypothetical protein